MPILWTIDHAQRMVVGAAEGPLCQSDVEEYLEGLALAATLSYCKLLDLTWNSSAISGENLLCLSTCVIASRSAGTMVPVAIVVSNERAFQQAKHFGELTASNRPLKVFRDLQAAHR